MRTLPACAFAGVLSATLILTLTFTLGSAWALSDRPAARVEPEAEPAVPESALPDPMKVGLAMVTGADPSNTNTVGGINCHSPAARAGLMGGDRIVEANGKPIRNVTDLRRVLYAAQVQRKRSIELQIEGFLRFEGKAILRSATMPLPRNWWQADPK